MIGITPKVALITGGSKGIGRACCIKLAKEGFSVAFNYGRDDASAAETTKAVEKCNQKVRAYRADLAEGNAARRLVETVVSDFGRLDLLVNNAAIAPTTSIAAITVEEWDQVLNVNLRSAFFCAQAALSQMQKQAGGRIVFMSSQAGQAGGVFVGAHYVASKAAILGITKSFAKLGASHGVLVNCISPGQIDTPLTATFPGEKVRAFTEAIPLKRMGTAEEVANAVAFLASEASSYITGATIPVNGGLLMT
jgi:3-oxoacyl-[acyl-carrier protein] reductase